MHIQLLVAIFDYPSLAEEAIQGAIATRPDSAQALSTVSLFDRMLDNTLVARMVQLGESGNIFDVNRKTLSEELLKSLVPSRADWRVMTSAFGQEYPQTGLNGEFYAFLQVMMLKRTCSVFFVPKASNDADHFVSTMRDTAAVLLRTTMTQEELQTLRVSLIASRCDEAVDTV